MAERPLPDFSAVLKPHVFKTRPPVFGFLASRPRSGNVQSPILLTLVFLFRLFFPTSRKRSFYGGDAGTGLFCRVQTPCVQNATACFWLPCKPNPIRRCSNLHSSKPRFFVPLLFSNIPKAQPLWRRNRYRTFLPCSNLHVFKTRPPVFGLVPNPIRS